MKSVKSQIEGRCRAEAEAAREEPDLTNLDDKSVRALSREDFDLWQRQTEDRAYGWDDVITDAGEHQGKSIRELSREELQELDYYAFPLKSEVLDSLYGTGTPTPTHRAAPPVSPARIKGRIR